MTSHPSRQRFRNSSSHAPGKCVGSSKQKRPGRGRNRVCDTFGPAQFPDPDPDPDSDPRSARPAVLFTRGYVCRSVADHGFHLANVYLGQVPANGTLRSALAIGSRAVGPIQHATSYESTKNRRHVSFALSAPRRSVTASGHLWRRGGWKSPPNAPRPCRLRAGRWPLRPGRCACPIARLACCRSSRPVH